MCTGILVVCISVYYIDIQCPRGQKKVLDLLGVELQMVISHHVGAEDQT